MNKYAVTNNCLKGEPLVNTRFYTKTHITVQFQLKHAMQIGTYLNANCAEDSVMCYINHFSDISILRNGLSNQFCQFSLEFQEGG